MSSPAVVRKWVPRHARRKITTYRPHYFSARTYLTNCGVYVETIWNIDETQVMLSFELEPIRVVEWLNPEFQNAEADWPELVEVAAWVIRLDNPQHIALAQQVASGLGGDRSSLFLQHDRCTSYRIENAVNYHPLRQVLFS